jgi:hypothetical protein
MMHTTNTALAIDSAIRAGAGDYRATARTTARFCTESLRDAAEQCLASLTTAERAKFATTVSGVSQYRRDRDWAVSALCAYTSAVSLREWSAAYTAQRDAAIAADLTARAVRW